MEKEKPDTYEIDQIQETKTGWWKSRAGRRGSSGQYITCWATEVNWDAESGLVDLTVDASQQEFSQADGGHLGSDERFSINNILEYKLLDENAEKSPIQETTLTRIECFSLRSLSSVSRKLLAWLSEPIWMNWIPSCTYPYEKRPRRPDTNNVPGNELRPLYPIAWRCAR